jgi:iron complex outermembrane recepter protein
MSRLRRTLAIGASALVFAAAAPTFAQSAQGSEEAAGATPDIVVTAQFREQNLQDTPLAITAVNAEMLEARGQTDIAAVAGQAPNVVLLPQQQSNGIGLIAFIRGIGQTDFNYALEPGVGVYVDDVYIPTLSSSLLDLMDLDRIEVLRGPQGTLAGRNSIGGAIKLFSQRPQGSNSGSLQATYGSFNRIDVRAMADLKLTETLFARVSAVSKNQDGYVDLLDYGTTHPTSNVVANNPGTDGRIGTLGGRSFAAAKLALRWQPSDAIEVNLSGDYTRENNDAGAHVTLYGSNAATSVNGNPWLRGKNGAAIPNSCAFVPFANAYGTSCDTTPAGYDARFISYANFADNAAPTTQSPFKPFNALNQQSFRGWGLMGNVTAHVSDNLELVWISSYRKYFSQWGEDQDGTPVPVSTLIQTLNHHAWSQEVRFNGKLGDGVLDYTLGGFYFKQNGTLQARVDLNYAGIDFIHGPDQTPSTSKAVFFNGTFHPTDMWSISGGIRQTWDQKDYTYLRSNPDGTVPGPLPCAFFLGALIPGPTAVGNAPNCLLLGLYNVQGHYKGNRTDFRIETDVRFSPEFFVYASMATGYKGGGVNPRPFFGPSSGDCTVVPFGAPCNQIASFNPETLTTYELGFKADFLDRHLRLNGAVFFNKYKDIILTLTNCHGFSPCLQPNNVGKADVKGFELELNARPTDSLTFSGSLSYIDFEYKNTGTSGVPLTNVTPYTPKWTYSFGVQQDFTVGSGTVSARFDGQYRSEVFTDAFNAATNLVDSQFLANARLSYTTEDRGWSVALEVKNLFDRYYYASVEDAKNAFGTISASPGLPRTFAVTVKRSF